MVLIVWLPVHNNAVKEVRLIGGRHAAEAKSDCSQEQALRGERGESVRFVALLGCRVRHKGEGSNATA